MPLTEQEKTLKTYKGVFIILLAIVSAVGLNALLLTADKKIQIENPDTSVTPETVALPSFTSAEVATHTTANDCWMIAYGNVYDITEYIAAQTHPGGQSSLTSGCGQDMTNTFDRIHSPAAKAELEQFLVGVLQPE